MKKYFLLLILLTILTGCYNPSGRSWIIPVTIDPSDLTYTPAHLEGFEMRRNQLLSSLDEGYVLLRSNEQGSYNRHRFRPNNYFLYLTGFEAPSSFVLLSKSDEYPFTLSMPRQSIRTLIYDGGHLSEEEVMEMYKPDRLLSFQEFAGLLDSILSTGDPVYVDRSDRTFLNDLQNRVGEDGSTEFRNISSIADELRVIKDPMEIERLQKANNITSRAMTHVMKECAPGMFEFEMESIIEGTFLQYGAALPGFSSIVGSGPNSTILHYEQNDRLMEDGELLLLDIGAEYGYYTADITRTIPVNGKFSREQRTIYELVLEAQKAAIEVLKPGHMLGEGHMIARDIILGGLIDLGLITDSSSAWQAKFYVLYQSSHYLGMDVHDVGDYGFTSHSFGNDTLGARSESRLLEPGMVLTIEPGLYFREAGLDQLYELFGRMTDSTEIEEFIEQVTPVYETYKNIGVRIEDDILITRDGNINLSRYAPKEINDIEQLMR